MNSPYLAHHPMQVNALALVSAILGFTPTESMSVIPVSHDPDEVGLAVLRVDLPPVGHEADYLTHLGSAATARGMAHVVFVIHSADESTATCVANQAETTLVEAGLKPRLMLWADGTLVREWEEFGWSAPQPYDIADHPVVLREQFNGVPVTLGREAVTSQLYADTNPLNEALSQLAAIPGPATVVSLLEAYVEAGNSPSDFTAAELVSAMQNPDTVRAVRDLIDLRPVQELADLCTELSARAPDQVAGPVTVLAAYSQWKIQNGVLLGEAVEKSERLGSADPLLPHLKHAVTTASGPDQYDIPSM